MIGALGGDCLVSGRCLMACLAAGWCMERARCWRARHRLDARCALWSMDGDVIEGSGARLHREAGTCETAMGAETSTSVYSRVVIIYIHTGVIVRSSLYWTLLSRTSSLIFPSKLATKKQERREKALLLPARLSPSSLSLSSSP